LFNLTKRRALRVAATTLLTGSLVVGTAGTSDALVSDRPSSKFPSFNGTVDVIVHKGNRIYVGGEFTSVNGKPRNHAAAVDASTGNLLSWNPNVNGAVHALAVTKEGVYVGGDFTQVGGRSRGNVAVVSARTGATRKGFAPRTNRVVNAFTFSRRTVYFGGAFTTVDGKFRNGLAAVSRSRSARLRAWSPDAKQGQVTDLVRRGKGIYVGGTFSTLNGSSGKAFLGRVSARTGGVTPSVTPAAPKQGLRIQVTAPRAFAAMGGPGGGGGLAVPRTQR